jgi:hypothetical protein
MREIGRKGLASTAGFTQKTEMGVITPLAPSKLSGLRRPPICYVDLHREFGKEPCTRAGQTVPGLMLALLLFGKFPFATLVFFRQANSHQCPVVPRVGRAVSTHSNKWCCPAMPPRQDKRNPTPSRRSGLSLMHLFILSLPGSLPSEQTYE